MLDQNKEKQTLIGIIKVEITSIEIKFTWSLGIVYYNEMNPQ